MNENSIKTLSITELLGHNFYIPEYQRGYRWTKTNVSQLLEDIWEYRKKGIAKTYYCLQPVVVKKHIWKDIDGNSIEGFELIDGQQRLTTLHRIITYLTLEYLHNNLKSEGYTDNLYSIYYKTRLESKTFLETNEINCTKPDLYYMSEAYQCIKEWFENGDKGIPRQVKDEMLKIILPSISLNDKEEKETPEWSVQVIWYEVKDEQKKSEELFTRLNRGKIPLTSAELIKAKFVNSDSFKGMAEDDKIKRRTQLVQIWDEIENQLNNPKFWAFISNEKPDTYNNKIEYLFDIIAKKKPDERDPLFSFIHFFDEKETFDSLWKKWVEVEEIYRSLVYWYSNKNLYHKIGYLITTGISIGNLIKIKKENTKLKFEKEIDQLIADSIDDNWEELSYDKSSDHDKIIRVLLLINIELIRANNNSHEFFPFEMYKSITKSLEHIHAQNIEGINENKREEWFNWLRSHTNILLNVAIDKEKAEKIIKEVHSIDEKTYRYEEFKALSEKILKLIPSDDSNENDYLHTIQNMALLGLTENISLSNSVFEVKRKKIIEMDRSGAFIPLATKRIFLKYYASDNSRHYSVWTQHERETYLDEIRDCIKLYKKTITVEEHEK
ncbi:hypothetical protein DRF65_05095 [Chryseobacterium pennae]|uniref:GmrSD restriction endonucleases N-terminal domain-containing protein n=1 Tax=Chryseobacterium pennae TaxID=2258962 RepID=A0A3D9CC96_9FLAO|nr:DUF262 domain-containing protein [Chryseobacterium pennae]REC63475.1 hypothetical protein DRF65_05095 [Chryseobacterium pennae]